MSGYGAREVARMLGLSVGQVRAWVRAGFLEPERGARGALRFSFQDLVLLRTAKGLLSARIPPRRVRSALSRLRMLLPEGRSLRGVKIIADGDRIVVGDGDARWQADSGQVLFDFDTAELARKVAPLFLRSTRAGEGGLREAGAAAESAADWYERGCDLEEAAPAEARAAYRRALELDPAHPDAHLNLGRLLHEAGDATAAAAQYRSALASRPADATAEFNLGVALEDLGQTDDAVAAYARALALDPALADAHYNAARLYEKKGQAARAIRHLRTYKQLTD
ncbi:MAG TPA: tetratricopeptide repeat protein [Myxococcales bacterium]|nr:tetratricopeptide repeat protein [Myxococcales bacterium]